MHELSKYEWEIIGLSETRWEGKGEFFHDGYRILSSGRTDGKHRDGVALVLKPKASQSLLAFNPISHRIIKARFKIKWDQVP